MNRRVLLLSLALAACNHTGKVRVDTPILPYQKPDISEITGIDEDEADASEAKTPEKPAAPATPAKK